MEATLEIRFTDLFVITVGSYSGDQVFLVCGSRPEGPPRCGRRSVLVQAAGWRSGVGRAPDTERPTEPLPRWSPPPPPGAKTAGGAGSEDIRLDPCLRGRERQRNITWLTGLVNILCSSDSSLAFTAPGFYLFLFPGCWPLPWGNHYIFSYTVKVIKKTPGQTELHEVEWKPEK